MSVEPQTERPTAGSGDMHRELRSRAARAGMSLSDYLRQELERLVARPPMAEVLARAEARSTGLTTADVVAAVRADRESR